MDTNQHEYGLGHGLTRMENVFVLISEIRVKAFAFLTLVCA
jgi:hypothetical protein